MNRNRGIFSCLLAGIGMLTLIFDAETALSGAVEGIRLCLNTVVPSLFPFIVLSMVLTWQLQCIPMPWLRPLQKWLGLPKNGEKLLLIGILGGYPVGAQCIRLAYDAGAISSTDAQRMLRFCNNAGPAFIFGIGVHLLGSIGACWLAWLIHILSALLVGYISPFGITSENKNLPVASVSWTEATHRAIRVMATICSWVVLFRIILAFFGRWVFWAFPSASAILLSGLIELTNGCTQLAQLESMESRFILFVTMLSFGGLCVGLQTQGVLSGSGLSSKPYFLGKTAQAALSCIVSAVVVQWFPGDGNGHIIGLWLIIPLVICLLYYFSCRTDKIRIAFRKKMVYTELKSTGGGTYESISQKS